MLINFGFGVFLFKMFLLNRNLVMNCMVFGRFFDLLNFMVFVGV